MEFNEFEDELNEFGDELDESLFEENTDDIIQPENTDANLNLSLFNDNNNQFNEAIRQILMECTEEDKLLLFDNMVDEADEDVRRRKL